MVLAGALWRIFFEMRHDVDPAHLELMVAYIRKQVSVSVKGSLQPVHCRPFVDWDLFHWGCTVGWGGVSSDGGWGGVSRQWCGVGWGEQTVVWGGVE